MISSPSTVRLRWNAKHLTCAENCKKGSPVCYNQIVLNVSFNSPTSFSRDQAISEIECVGTKEVAEGRQLHFDLVNIHRKSKFAGND